MTDEKPKRPPRVCPECGCDTHKAEAFDRLSRERWTRQHVADDIARTNGLLRYQLAVAEAEAAERVAGMQAKINRQGRALRRLERKLRERGQRPYEDATIEEAPSITRTAESEPRT